MATVETIVLVCDLCKAEGDSVQTHTLAVDGRTTKAEVCSRCWTKLEKALVPLVKAGRRLRRGRRAA